MQEFRCVKCNKLLGVISSSDNELYEASKNNDKPFLINPNRPYEKQLSIKCTRCKCENKMQI